MTTNLNEQRASSVPPPSNKRKLCLVLDCVEIPPLPPRKRQKYDGAPSVQPRQTRSATGKSPAKVGKGRETSGKAPTTSREAVKSAGKESAQNPPSRRGRRASISGPPPTTRLGHLGIPPKPKRLPPRSRFRTRSASPVNQTTTLAPTSATFEPPNSSKSAAGMHLDDKHTEASMQPSHTGQKGSSSPSDNILDPPAPSRPERKMSDIVSRAPQNAQGSVQPAQSALAIQDVDCQPVPDAPPSGGEPRVRTSAPLVLPPSPPPSTHVEFTQHKPVASDSNTILAVEMNNTIPRIPLPPPLEVRPAHSKSKARTSGHPFQKARTEGSIDSALDDFALDFAMLLPEYDGYLTSNARHIIHHMQHTLALGVHARRQLEEQLSAEILARVVAERDAERLRTELEELQQEAEERRARKQARHERRAAEAQAAARAVSEA